MEIIFGVTQDSDGGYVAAGQSHDIFTQGNTWDELRINVRSAVAVYFFDPPKPAAGWWNGGREERFMAAGNGEGYERCGGDSKV